MVIEVIVLGKKISKWGIEVYKGNIEVIKKLPPPVLVKVIQSFLEHASFYQRFIKDFSRIDNLLCKLFKKEVKFVFDATCLKVFECLKKRLV